MVGGQVDDLAWERRRARPRPRDRSTTLEHIHARKTGALFRACLRLGVLGGPGRAARRARPELLERLDGYGRCFGLAFQITDDLLDVEGSAEQTGKRVQQGRRPRQADLSRPARRRGEPPPGRATVPTRPCEHLAPLGPAGEPLAALARFVAGTRPLSLDADSAR